MSDLSFSFEEAVHLISALSSPSASHTSPLVKVSQEEKLKLYGLYKQSKEGDIDQVEIEKIGINNNLNTSSSKDKETKRIKGIPQPGFFDFVGRSKWDAWNKEKGKSRMEAEVDYVALVTKIISSQGILEWINIDDDTKKEIVYRNNEKKIKETINFKSKSEHNVSTSSKTKQLSKGSMNVFQGPMSTLMNAAYDDDDNNNNNSLLIEKSSSLQGEKIDREIDINSMEYKANILKTFIENKDLDKLKSKLEENNKTKEEQEKEEEVKSYKEVLVDYIDQEGMTILHHACDIGNPDLIRFLLKYPIEQCLFQRNEEKESPLSIAIICNHVDVVHILITYILKQLSVSTLPNDARDNTLKEKVQTWITDEDRRNIDSDEVKNLVNELDAVLNEKSID